MAGDWIKVGTDILDKPEVVAIAELTGLDEYAVVGRLIRVWSWFDRHTENGCASVTLAFLNRAAGCENFANAMCNVGWLTSDENSVSLPNFERHNGQTAKVRALASNRMKRKRSDARATEAQPEKRREEKSVRPPLVPQKADAPILFSLQAKNGDTFELTQAHLDRWKELFGSVDVFSEWRNAVAWLECDETRKPKSHRGAKQFFSNWMKNARTFAEEKRIRELPGSRVPTDEDLAAWRP